MMSEDSTPQDHIVSRTALIVAAVTGRAPRAMCGDSAEGTPHRHVCPECAAKDPQTAAKLADGHTTG